MYQKFKDERPEDTLFKIQTILHDAGISTTYRFVENDMKGLYSNRVTINGTNLGTNGKGTTPVFALASAYGELMERLQNNMLYVGLHRPDLSEKMGFEVTADECRIPAEEYLKQENSFLKFVFQSSSCDSFLKRLMMLNTWCDPKDGKITGIPFYNVREKQVEYLPYKMYLALYGSNGMCAGNTPAEALVQGMSEVYERYVTKYLLQNPVTPPDVPEEYLKKYPEQYCIISNIREKGYRVVVKDLSLNEGYPVVGTIITDRRSKTYGFRLAAHPSFSIALERTLTEAFQGRTLDNFTSSVQTGSDMQAGSVENITNIFKCGSGYYRKELLYKEPDYAFSPFEEFGELTNQQLLEKMVNPLIRKGYTVLIRDSGYLGFPAYHIIVPGFSEMYFCTPERIRQIHTLHLVSEKAVHPEGMKEEDAKRIIRLIRYNQRCFGSNSLAWLLRRPFKQPFEDRRFEIGMVLMAAHYFLDELDEACAVGEAILKCLGKEEKDVFRMEMEATVQYVSLMKEGESSDSAKQVLKFLFEEAIVQKVTDLFGNPKEVLRKILPEMKCWDCEHCRLSLENQCCYFEIYQMYLALAQKQKENIIDQNTVGNIFNHFGL